MSTAREDTTVGIPPITPYPMPLQDDLPASTPAWAPDPGRAVLLVHDMQRYFVRPFAPVQARELVANCAALVDRARALGIPVAYTAQPGGMTPEQRGLLKDIWGPGMTTTPEDREVIDELAPDADSALFTKWRYSAFFNNGLLDYLRTLGRDQLIICGVYAHVGCLMTAVDAFTNDIETFFVADATADFTPEYHRLALDYAAARCAVVLTTSAILSSVDRMVAT
ncbi:putative isochorismatase PhzD [Lentzea sp. NBRC 105346]|uniref:isochorismatase family protein n=1 Tax=Lentzea sp. NBRC 105346 TaxID=3032205 RepID=UPI0024A4B337|nr:isochorismatase family protein [Lentzea sp. NBRC 105346]GLZ29315.1 putative isochorismatase PhzD [Lentzea sp. NBRC 105346]